MARFAPPAIGRPRRLLARLLLSGLALILAGPAGAATVASDGAPAVRVIVQYRSGSAALASGAPRHAAAMGSRLGQTLQDGPAVGPRAQVMTSASVTASALLAQLRAQPDVEWAVVDQRRQAFTAPNDPLYTAGQTLVTPVAGQWYLHAPDTDRVAAIGAEAAWSVTTGLSSVVVAVVDTGVRFDHPDLAEVLLPGYDFVSDSAAANDGNGRDDDASDPGDWVASSDLRSRTFSGCSTSASSWHGTQVAGLAAAATDNGLGMASIGRGLKVLPVRVLGKCGGYDSDIIAGVRWAAGLAVSGVPANPYPARVINLSLGGSGSCSSAWQAAIDEVVAAGVTVVAAAGNDGLAIGAPANCSGVIAVTGVRHSGTKVGYSSLGAAATIAAPAGNCVNLSGTCLYPLVTTLDTGTTVPVASSYSDGENASLGTSFSAPLVAGTVGLMASVNAGLTPALAESLLRSTARPFPTTGADSGVTACTAPGSAAQLTECYCTTSTCGAGLLDAGAATAAAAAAVVAATPPTAVISGGESLESGAVLTLSASSSTAQGSRTIVQWSWVVVDGAAAASIEGSASSVAVSLRGLSAGTATLQLTVTDSAGLTASATQVVSVTEAAADTSTTVSSGNTSSSTTSGSTGSSSGGGAASPLWLLGLLGAAAALRRAGPGPTQQRPFR